MLGCGFLAYRKRGAPRLTLGHGDGRTDRTDCEKRMKLRITSDFTTAFRQHVFLRRQHGRFVEPRPDPPGRRGTRNGMPGGEWVVIIGVFKLRCITKGKGGLMANRRDMSHPKRRLVCFQTSNSKKMQICRYFRPIPVRMRKKCKSAGISSDLEKRVGFVENSCRFAGILKLWAPNKKKHAHMQEFYVIRVA